jgi:uncharacterized protein
MTILELALVALALFGHAALWIGVYNRLHSGALPEWLVSALEKVIYFGLLAAPAAGLWEIWRGGSFWRPDEAALILPVYTWICWGVALGPGMLWLLRRSEANPRGVLLSNDSQFRDVAAEVDRPLLHGLKANVLGRIPRNEILKLQINEKTLRLPELPANLEGLSIVHLTDLHFTGRIDRAYFEYVIEEANLLEGDLVAVTGDLVDKARCIAWIPETLGRLRGRCGVYGVLGNHDRRLRDVELLRRTLAESGVTLLGGRWMGVFIPENDATLRGCETNLVAAASRRRATGKPPHFRRRDAAATELLEEQRPTAARVLLAGDERPWFTPGPDLREAPPPASAFRILLAHTPDRFHWAQEQQFSLMLAGHNHGGQIRLPVLGPLITPSRHGVKYASGVFREQGTVLHVSRGVSGEHPIRFNCLPEVTRLVLTGAAADSP